MQDDDRQSQPHRRTRRDHQTETAEDYVEAIDDLLQEQGSCRVTDLARRFAVSHVTVSRIVARLQEEGLLQTEPYRPITLTSKGKRLANKARRRHEIVHAFLRAIGVDEATAAVDAEGIEHHVSPQTLTCFSALTAFLQQHPLALKATPDQKTQDVGERSSQPGKMTEPARTTSSREEDSAGHHDSED